MKEGVQDWELRQTVNSLWYAVDITPNWILDLIDAMADEPKCRTGLSTLIVRILYAL